ncbi:antibiotic biosynthesis monooxygenase [Cellulophaga baltica]|uniref:antibiotic biosynthesis monooxygenase family protein n=1 Tax=Cellulophaga TaxID=104264 RepID=UPI001C0689BE|nr:MULTISPECIES: antibiotic biosynthesis monooxygenase [Cellulophaga]MBU2995718.1 antibiotic biosynthesis monooxygenase [Cellulophaga baltica]MDO6767112.1 antibiotic biosynthesis monooxygenase [Cellulophaga sp. 1_MG-2023]
MILNPPYYAVIFTSTRTDEDNGYGFMGQKMEDLAREQEGFLGVESAREEIGITVSYWKNLEAIANWKQQAYHVFAQQKGRKDWYSSYRVRICLVERAYEFEK